MLYPDFERRQCKARELKIRESCAHDRLVQRLKEEATAKKTRPNGHTRGKHRLTPLHWMGFHGALFLLLISLFLALAVPAQARSMVSPAKELLNQVTFQLPLQTYAGRLSLRDLPTLMAEEYQPAATYPGRWELTLQPEGRYSIAHRGETFFGGQFSQSPEQPWLVLTCAPEFSGCAGHTGSLAVYNWTFDGQSLRLSEVEETSYLRGLVLTAHPLVLAHPLTVYTPGPVAPGRPPRVYSPALPS